MIIIIIIIIIICTHFSVDSNLSLSFQHLTEIQQLSFSRHHRQWRRFQRQRILQGPNDRVTLNNASD